ncbi:MAG: hypothetical protein ABIT36_08090, partial [Steroidobacteraceae bacterium]
VHVTRLTSGASDVHDRLVEYLEHLPRTLRSYDTLELDAFAFACTGSSYLLGATAEAQLVAEATTSSGYPVETAARAILWALARQRARRIALLAPYPATLVDAGVRYWIAAGIEVVHVERIEIGGSDTRRIYSLSSDALVEPLRRVPRTAIDAVLISGTGLESLPAIAQASRSAPLQCPLLTSNLCLAARTLELAGATGWLTPGSIDIRGWQKRLAEATDPGC